MAKKKLVNPVNKLSLTQSFLDATGQLPENGRNELPDGNKSRRSSTNTEYIWERFAFICERTLVAKVKAIATKEEITIRELMEYMMSLGIARYEKKNGAVDTGIEVPGKKRLKDIM